MKAGGFDVSLFFRDVISPPEDESELGLQHEPCEKLADLQRRVRAKEQKKRTMAKSVSVPTPHFSSRSFADVLISLSSSRRFFPDL